jgi:hypothetical protein
VPAEALNKEAKTTESLAEEPVAVKVATPKKEDANTDSVPPEEAEPAKEAEPEQESANDEEDEGQDDDQPSAERTEQKEDEEAVRKEAERRAEVQKIITSRKYYLPINAVGKRRAKRYVILGIVLIVILVAAWVDVALDAGMIHVHGIKPLTHFFSK